MLHKCRSELTIACCSDQPNLIVCFYGTISCVCSMLAEDAIKAAVKDYQAKRAAGKAPTEAAAEVKSEQAQAQAMAA